jgi:hypothetical protein
LSICHAAGSGWPAGHALPRARTWPFGKFSTRSLIVYHASGFHSKGTTTERCVSGSHGSSLSFWVVPYNTRL